MERIGHWLAEVCLEIRERHGAKQSVIAAQLNASEYKVRRFERQDGRWSPETDALIAAYAKMDGVHPSDLWAEAASRWQAAQAQRAAPQHTASTNLDRATAKMEQAAQVARQARQQPSPKPARAKARRSA